MLALNLTKALYRTGENMVVSPFSLHACLTMVLFGADGITRTELLDVLFDLDADKEMNNIETMLANYAAGLKKLFRDNQSVLSNVNILYVHNQFPIKKEFVDTISVKFMAIDKKQDFHEPEMVRKTLDEDMKKFTNGLMINEKADENFLDDIIIILINAIYFKGKWKSPFNKRLVEERNFRISHGHIIKVKMMFQRGDFFYYHHQELNVAALALEYSSGTVNMVILLPDRGSSVGNLLQKLNAANLKHILDKLDKFRGEFRCEVDLYLPKFRLEAIHDLIPHLKQMGLRSVFSHGANLPGISCLPTYISKIFQKVIINVDEEGTEAAVSTRCRLISLPVTTRRYGFKADRPFVFLLVSMDRRHILFTGVVENPRFS